jgi:uncharacterized protein (TIGR03905 family)
MYQFTPSGVCSQNIVFEIEDGVVKGVAFYGGCNGNLTGLSRLIENMPVNEAIEKLSGISCGGRPTSCPDQLAQALKLALEHQAG